MVDRRNLLREGPLGTQPQPEAAPAQDRRNLLANLRPGAEQIAPQRPPASPLAEYGLEEDEAAIELLSGIEGAQNENARRRAIAELAGYIDGRQGGEGLERAGSRAETALRGFGQGLFGIGDYAAAAGGTLRTTVEGSGFGFRENLAYQRGRRQGMQAINPASGTTGFVAGLFPGGVARAGASAGGAVAPAVGRAARPAAAGISRVAQRAAQLPGVRDVGRLLARGPQRSRVGNIARAGAQAGLASGTAALLETGDIEQAGQAAALGAVAGPAVEGVARGVGRGLRSAVRRLRPEQSGLVALARRLDQPVEELQQRFDEFRAVNNRAPRLVELLDEAEAREVSDVIAVGTQGPRVIRQAAEEAAVERQADIAGAVRRERVETGPTMMRERARRSMDAFMDEAGNRPVELDGEDISNLLRRGEGALPRRLRQRILDAEEVPLTLRDVDNVRQELRRAARRGGANAEFGVLADDLTEVATEQVPEYGQAIGEFARRQRTREGLEVGRRVRTPGDAADFVAQLRLSPTEAQAGARVGARAALAESAEEGATAAARTARELAEGEGLQRRITQALGGEEAARLQRVGETQLRGARALAIATPQARTLTQQDSQLVSEAIRGVVLAGGRASGAFQAAAARNLLGLVNGDRARAAQLARALSDPDAAPNAIQRLRQLGADQQRIRDIYVQSARAAGITTGVLTAEPEEEDMPQ